MDWVVFDPKNSRLKNYVRVNLICSCAWLLLFIHALDALKLDLQPI